MADLKHNPGGIQGLRNAMYHDEGDGTHDEAYAAHLRAWDTSNLRWSRVAVNGVTGALVVEATLATADIEIGAVEIKNAADDTRAKVVTAAPAGGDAGLVVHVASNPSQAVTATQLPAALAANGGMKVEGVAGGVAQPVSLATLPALVAGSANIGDVDVLTLPSLVAGTALIGKVTLDGGGDIASATAAPVGTERGLIVRAISSGGGFATQAGTGLTASGQSSTATGLGAAGSVTLSVKGTYGFTTTPPTYIFEASDDSGTTWYPIAMVREDTNIAENTGTLPVNGIRAWSIALGGFDQIRMRTTAWGTPSGTLVTKWSPGGDYYEPTVLQNPSQRVQFTCAITNDTMTTTDAVRTTLLATRDFVAAGAAASLAVTAGKRLRLTGWTMVVKAPSTTAVGGQYTLRVNPSGTAIVTSPVVATIGCGLIGTQVAQTATSAAAEFPDGGIELWGLNQFTVSGQGIASAGFYLTIVGYEF